MSESGTNARTRHPRYWTLVREGSSHSDILTIDPDGQGEALVVFGFEEEADLFLGFEETDAVWQPRETTGGELISMLYGPCANVDRVVIDPLPGGVAQRWGTQPLSVRSADFASSMVDAGGSAAGALPALAYLRP